MNLKPLHIQMGLFDIFKNKDSAPHIKYPITALKNSTPKSSIYYKEGDQFLVTDDSDLNLYEVLDPSTKLVVVVQKQHFTVEIKQHINSLFGTCLYPFEAKNEDELSMAENEQFLVISKVNEDWYYGKAISRVAKGIIPISYVEVRDAKTGKIINKNELNLPNMTEYQLQNQRQKEISIPLKHVSNSRTSFLVENLQLKKQLSENYLLKHASKVSTPEEVSDYSDVSVELQCRNFGKILGLEVVGSIINDNLCTQFSIYCKRDSISYTVYRGQKDFIDLHNALLEFEIELPIFPNPISFWTREKTDVRILELASYVNKIMEMSDEICQSIPLKEFIQPREFDKMGGLYRDPSEIEIKIKEDRRRSSF